MIGVKVGDAMWTSGLVLDLSEVCAAICDVAVSLDAGWTPSESDGWTQAEALGDGVLDVMNALNARYPEGW